MNVILCKENLKPYIEDIEINDNNNYEKIFLDDNIIICHNSSGNLNVEVTNIQGYKIRIYGDFFICGISDQCEIIELSKDQFDEWILEANNFKRNFEKFTPSYLAKLKKLYTPIGNLKFSEMSQIILDLCDQVAECQSIDLNNEEFEFHNNLWKGDILINKVTKEKALKYINEKFNSIANFILKNNKLIMTSLCVKTKSDQRLLNEIPEKFMNYDVVKIWDI